MNGADFEKNIDDLYWQDITEVMSTDPNFQNKQLEFTVPLATAFRFRYQSEIDKKSISAIKGENSPCPIIKVLSERDATLQLDLVTESSNEDNTFLHFNTFYDISKPTKFRTTFHDGVCFIEITKNSDINLKLDFLGIRKWKSKEAVTRIQQLYPTFNDAEAKKFFDNNKNTLKVRAMLVEDKYVLSNIISNPIKSSSAKEYKEIKIQHISPKTVADNNEKLIIVLEKKITNECQTYLLFETIAPILLQPSFQDGQTYVFQLPPYDLQNPITGKVRIKCDDFYDEKPISFFFKHNEFRKRKSSPVLESEIPLKKPTNYDSPQELYPESCNAYSTVEFDGPSSSMDVTERPIDTALISQDVHISGHDSCKDSGINSDDKSNSSDEESDDDSSFDDSDDDTDDIDTGRNQRRRHNQIKNLEPINFPPKLRELDSFLETKRSDQVSNKIFSEVARIGHDYAFGKRQIELFTRIEKQLPVVFTLQDDVGDTPLNNAILKGNVEPAEHILSIICNECKWALDLVNTSGHSALILAPACDVPADFIQKLLDAGCSLDKYDDLGKSAIIHSIEYKNTAALHVLLEHIKKNDMTSLLKKKEENYNSPLQIAVMNNYVEGVEMLLSLTDKNGNYMVDVNELSLMNEETALHIAVERDVVLEIIALLLSRSDINVNHKKNNDCTVLQTALKLKRKEVISLLQRYKTEDKFDNVDTKEDLDNEMEDDACTSTCSINDKCPEVEMSPQQSATNCSLTTISTEMENLSLKGDNRSRLIEVILSGSVVLTASELGRIIKPGYKPIFAKFGDSPQHRKEMIGVLERFNCLPNSMKQLFEKLREVERLDMIDKVAHFFNCLDS